MESDLLDSIFEFLHRIKIKCNTCGACCQNEMFFLNDVEASLVAQSLLDLVDATSVTNHIRVNPKPFNVFRKYIFNFSQGCPFYINQECKAGDALPMSCRIYPLSLVAFVDNENEHFRQPIFTLSGPKESYACYEEYGKIVDEIREISKDRPKDAMMIIVPLIAAGLLDKRGLSYCFGQLKQRGTELFQPKPLGKIGSDMELRLRLNERFYEIHKKIVEDWIEFSHEISEDELRGLIGSNANRRANQKMSKRLKYLADDNSLFLKWNNDFGKRMK